RRRPTPVEPVKVSFLVIVLRRSGSTTSAGRVVGITDRTPGGRPASRNKEANANIVNGVWWAGLTIIVHPAATAGAILRAPIASGKFHGVTIIVGPTGCLVVMMWPPPSGRRDILP